MLTWPPKKSDYPRQIAVADAIYAVKFVRKIDDIGTLGLCDSGEKVITIKLGQSRADTLLTFIHELFHCLEFEYHFDINHKTIHKLEKPVAALLFDNFL